tara:strand:- start:989 stop:1837 length:849 start_codon:yes stop_codon:yes gene_type:complete
MRLILTISLLACSHAAFSAPKPEVRKPDEVVVYRKTTQAELEIEIFRPQGWKAGDARSAVIFFFGGGWVGGSTTQFHPQATRLASLGVVAYCADYRVQSRHKTTPFEAVSDAKAAIRWIWRNAKSQGVDRDQIVAAGGSAGGHLAACCGLISGHDDVREGEPVFIPAAMALFNPVIDTSRKGYGYAKLKQRYRELSPVEHVHALAAPILLQVGSADTTTPPAGHELFKARMDKRGRNCSLFIAEGQKHGFFNPRGDNSQYWSTLGRMEAFLRKEGLLKAAGN